MIPKSADLLRLCLCFWVFADHVVHPRNVAKRSLKVFSECVIVFDVILETKGGDDASRLY